MNKVLVTGGTGFIGSHTCSFLLKYNYDIIIIDNLKNSDINTVNKLEVREFDMQFRFIRCYVFL